MSQPRYELDLLNAVESELMVLHEDGIPTSDEEVVDRVLTEYGLTGEHRQQTRSSLLADLREDVEYPCPADLGPTLRCALNGGHESSHQPIPATYADDATRLLADVAYLEGADPDGTDGGHGAD